MNLQNMFEIAGGSVVGRDHKATAKNNQDASYWTVKDDMLVAVVCDGCGSNPYSEFGAQYVARKITEDILWKFEHFGLRQKAEQTIECAPETYETIFKECDFWNNVRCGVLDGICDIADTMISRDALTYQENFASVIENYFLCSIVGALITPYGSTFFWCGDGFISCNGLVAQLGPFPDNKPPYCAYGIRTSLIHSGDHKPLPQLLTQYAAPIGALENILIGTDGLSYFIDAAYRRMPGKAELVGPLNQFWTEDKYFRNKDMIRRKLAMTNYDYSAIDWEQQKIKYENGLLKDDTTLVVIRRKKS